MQLSASARGLCALDLGQVCGGERAMRYCVLPTPELCRRSRQSGADPHTHSPGKLQQLFDERVRQAANTSLQSPGPDERVGRNKDLLVSFSTSSPDGSSRHELLEMSQLSPIALLAETDA